MQDERSMRIEEICLVSIVFFSLMTLPSVHASTTVSLAANMDNFLWNGTPTTNYGAEKTMEMASPTTQEHVLMNFTAISDIPQGSTVIDAKLSIFISSMTAGAEAYKYNISAISAGWTEAGSTWSNMAYQRNLATTVQNITPIISAAWLNFTVTNMIQTWVNDYSNIYGFYIEFNNQQSGVLKYAYVSARDHLTAAQRPVLSITYTEAASVVLTLTSPANTTYGSASITISGTADKTSNITWSMNGYANETSCSSCSTFNTVSSNHVAEGSNIIRVYAQNGTNWDSKIITFSVDTIAPNIAIQSPVNKTLNLTEAKNVTLNYTATDANPDKCWYSFDSGSNINLPSCINTTILIPAVGYHSIAVYANDTLGNSNSSSISFFIDFLNEIRVYNSLIPATYYDFSVQLANSTYAANSSSSSKVATFLTSQLPYGTPIFASFSGVGFNNSYQTIATINSTSQFNLTFGVLPAAVVINGVWDEQTLAAICYNYTFTNLTYSKTGGGCGSSSEDWFNLPTGINVKLSISNSSYVTRDYYLTINSNSYLSLNGHLLANSIGNYITTFVYSDSQPAGIPGALTSAMRYLNNSWVVVDQKTTDSQGKGYFYLYPWSQYQIKAEYLTLQALITNYYPNPSFILYIKFSDSFASSNLTWVFDKVSVIYFPKASYVAKDSLIPLSYLVSSSVNDLSYYGLKIYNVTGSSPALIYSNVVTTSPSGGVINVNLNTSGSVTKWLVLISFKRSGYEEWNYTYSYFASTYSPGGFGSYPSNILPNMLGNFTAGNLGPTSTMGISLVALIISFAAGGFVAAEASRFNIPTSFGGSMAFIIVLSVFTVAGLFSWGFLLLLAIAAIGINLARYL